MPAYIFQTGQMKVSRTTPVEAEAEALALVMFAEGIGRGPICSIAELSGGQYSGSESQYFSTRVLAQRLGVLLEPAS